MEEKKLQQNLSLNFKKIMEKEASLNNKAIEIHIDSFSDKVLLLAIVFFVEPLIDFLLHIKNLFVCPLQSLPAKAIMNYNGWHDIIDQMLEYLDALFEKIINK